jgi:hypothetical protein
MSDDERSSGSGEDRLSELRASAKGWHGVQMAVLGFIGLCGVLQRDDGDDPTWLQMWALLFAVGALATALYAIVLVGRAAWPLYGPQPDLPSQADADYAARVRTASKQLSRGLALTFVSVALLALGTASAWWPSEATSSSSSSGNLVEVRANSGQTVCGELADGSDGELRVVSANGPVTVSLQAVGSVRPVDSC